MTDDLKILPGQVMQLTTCSGPGIRARALVAPTTLRVCQFCGERPVEKIAEGHYGPPSMSSSCRRCKLKSMVQRARATADTLPELERMLAEEEAR